MPVASGETATEVNLNDTTPAAPAGKQNVQWQGGTPYTDPNNGKLVADVSAYVEAPIYDIWWSLPGMPDANIEYLIGKFGRTVNFPADFAGSVGKCLTSPAATAVFTLKKNGSSVGTVSISSSGVFTFSSSGVPVSFAVGDYLTVVTPTVQDTALADAGFTLLGSR